MIFKIHIPASPLHLYIDRLLYFEGYMPEHSIDRFVPDGNTEMVFDLTDRTKYIYDNQTLREIQSCNNAWVSGIRREPICIPSGKESKMLIAHFKKGRAFPFYPLPLNELTDIVVDADLIFGNAITALRTELLDSNHYEKMFLILERFFIQQAADRLNEDVSSRCTDFAVQEILNNPNQVVLSELSRKIGYSQKHLIALFKKHVGVSPKIYLVFAREGITL